VEYHVKKCDVSRPLVAIASRPVCDAIAEFDSKLDFEAISTVVRHCVESNNKPSDFPLHLGNLRDVRGGSVLDERRARSSRPVTSRRWIYAASKQCLDRVIYAYGVRETRLHAVQPVSIYAQPRQRRGARKAARECSRSFLSTCCSSDPSNSSMVAGAEAFLYVHRRCRRGVLTILENKDGSPCTRTGMHHLRTHDRSRQEFTYIELACESANTSTVCHSDVEDAPACTPIPCSRVSSATPRRHRRCT